MAKIETARGPIDSTALGTTLMHEHIFFLSTEIMQNYPEDWGDEDKDFRYNNYLNRFHTRHLDLMDVLSAFQPRAAAGLDAMARLCGFPGKLGLDGSAVYAAVMAGEIDSVRRYCETDVMNTYLLFLRFQRLRGVLSAEDYVREIAFARDRVASTGAVHWIEFLNAWKS